MCSKFHGTLRRPEGFNKVKGKTMRNRENRSLAAPAAAKTATPKPGTAGDDGNDEKDSRVINTANLPLPQHHHRRHFLNISVANLHYNSLKIVFDLYVQLLCGKHADLLAHIPQNVLSCIGPDQTSRMPSR